MQRITTLALAALMVAGVFASTNANARVFHHHHHYYHHHHYHH